MLYIFFIFVLFFTILSFRNWRQGIFWLIVVGIIKDSIRKITPGAPVILVISTVPVWCAILVGLINEQKNLWDDFKSHFPRFSKTILMFGVTLIPPAVIDLKYGTSGIMLAGIGFFFYMSIFMGFIIGFFYTEKIDEIFKVLAFYSIVTSLFMVGSVMEYLGIGDNLKIIGTSTLDTMWVKYTTSGVVRMISGFYRSPDVMGWHAASLFMISSILAAKSSGKSRFIWILIAGWGLANTTICGRRKMIFLLPLFIMMFTTFSVYGFRKIQINWKLMMVLLCTVLSGYYLYIKMGPDKNIETYYFSEEGMVERVEMHVWSVPIYTYKKYSGFWGQGLGISVHGAGYLVPDKPRGWQEGALGKVFMELGVPGAITLLYSGIVLMWTFFILIQKCHIFLSESEALFLFGSVAFFLSNLGQFLVSFQIMGDPFIASFLTIIAGLSLSLTKYSDKKLEL